MNLAPKPPLPTPRRHRIQAKSRANLSDTYGIPTVVTKAYDGEANLANFGPSHKVAQAHQYVYHTALSVLFYRSCC